MKKEIWILGILFLVIGTSFSLTVNTYDTSGNPYHTIYYDISTSTFPTTSLVVEVCNQTLPKYITLAYGDQGNYTAVAKSPITGQDIYVALGTNYTKNNQNCANATIYTIETQPSDTTYGPWSYSIVPAKLWLVMKNDNTSNINPSTDNFYYLGNNLIFAGYYSIAHGYFNYTTGYLQVKLNSANCNTGSSTITKTSSEKDHQSIVYGICNNINGISCSDTRLENFGSTVGKYINLNTGHSNVNDKQTYTIYYVINGMGYPIDLGADLKATSLSTPNTIYWGQKVPVSITMKNIGNVPVTHSFKVELIYNESGNVQTFTKTVNSIPVGGTYTVNFNEPWKFGSTGTGTITVKVDSNNNINETDENNNYLSKSVTLEPSYNMTMVSLVDNSPIGTSENPFPYSKMPYGVNISIQENPQNTFSSLNVYLIEENGVNILDPEVSNSKVIVTLNIPKDGLNTTIVPSKINNNYKLYFSGLKFYNGTDVVDEIPIFVSSTSGNINPYVGIANKNLIESMLNYFGRIYYHLYQAIV